MRTLALVALFVASPLALYADNDQKIIELGTDVYDALNSIYLESGLAPPSQAGPYSVDELRLAVDRIDPSVLSTAGKRAYNYVRSYLTHTARYREGTAFQFDSHPSVAVGGYAQTNPQAEDDTDERGWADRPAFLTVPLEVWLFNHFYADAEISARQDPFVAENLTSSPTPSGFTGNPTNLPFTTAQLYAETPYRAFMSGGGSHWNLDFGRDTLSWGNGPFGNLLLSNNPDYYDFLRFTTYWKNFKYTAAYIDLPPYFPGYTTLNDATVMENGNSVEIQMSKIMLTHRLEFRLWDRATIAVSEALVIAGIDPSLSYLNPLDIFHNWNIWEAANDIASLELSVNPFKWLNLFGQAAINQIGGSVEIYPGADNTPTAGGLLAGAQGAFPLGLGYLEVAGQWTTTAPWLYIGGSSSNGPMPWTTLDAERRYLSNFLGTDPIFATPVGWLYGPDSLVYNLSAAYKRYGQYMGGVEFRYQLQGSNTIDTPHAYGADAAALTTPSGPNPIDTTVVHFFGTWQLPRFWGMGFGLGADAYIINVENVAHNAGEDDFNVQLVGTVTVTF